jgi:hypothetical protein
LASSVRVGLAAAACVRRAKRRWGRGNDAFGRVPRERADTSDAAQAVWPGGGAHFGRCSRRGRGLMIMGLIDWWYGPGVACILASHVYLFPRSKKNTISFLEKSNNLNFDSNYKNDISYNKTLIISNNYIIYTHNKFIWRHKYWLYIWLHD